MKYSLHFFAHLDKWFFRFMFKPPVAFCHIPCYVCVYFQTKQSYMYLLFSLVFTLLIIINKPAKVWDFVSFKLPYGVYLAVFKIITHAYDTNAYSRTYVTKRKKEKKRKEFKFLIFQKHNGNCEIRRFHTENFLISKHFRFVTFSIVCYIVSQNFFNFFYLLFILISPIRNS